MGPYGFTVTEVRYNIGFSKNWTEVGEGRGVREDGWPGGLGSAGWIINNNSKHPTELAGMALPNLAGGLHLPQRRDLQREAQLCRLQPPLRQRHHPQQANRVPGLASCLQMARACRRRPHSPKLKAVQMHSPSASTASFFLLPAETDTIRRAFAAGVTFNSTPPC